MKNVFSHLWYFYKKDNQWIFGLGATIITVLFLAGLAHDNTVSALTMKTFAILMYVGYQIRNYFIVRGSIIQQNKYYEKIGAKKRVTIKDLI